MVSMLRPRPLTAIMFLNVTLAVGVILNMEYIEVNLEGKFYWENPLYFQVGYAEDSSELWRRRDR